MQRGKTQESESSTPKAALKAPLAASNMEEGGGGGGDFNVVPAPLGQEMEKRRSALCSRCCTTLKSER